MLIISSMRLGRTEKYSLALVFSIGMISIAASVIRAGIVGERFVNAIHTWDTVWVWMLWSHAEMFFGVIAFTLPSFRYILLRGINKVTSSSRNRGYGSMKSSSRGKSQKLQDSHNGTMGSRIGGRSGVLVETTVTLKEEHRFRSDSETELTAIKGSALQKPANYEWKMDSRTDSM